MTIQFAGIEDRQFVITGGAGGIGRACARQLLDGGAQPGQDLVGVLAQARWRAGDLEIGAVEQQGLLDEGLAARAEPVRGGAPVHQLRLVQPLAGVHHRPEGDAARLQGGLQFVPVPQCDGAAQDGIDL